MYYNFIADDVQASDMHPWIGLRNTAVHCFPGIRTLIYILGNPHFEKVIKLCHQYIIHTLSNWEVNNKNNKEFLVLEQHEKYISSILIREIIMSKNDTPIGWLLKIILMT